MTDCSARILHKLLEQKTMGATGNLFSLGGFQQDFKEAKAGQGETEEDDEEDNLAVFHDSAAAFFDQTDQPIGDQVNDDGVQRKKDEICHVFSISGC
jgi:hypothetical protein